MWFLKEGRICNVRKAGENASGGRQVGRRRVGDAHLEEDLHGVSRNEVTEVTRPVRQRKGKCAAEGKGRRSTRDGEEIGRVWKRCEDETRCWVRIRLRLHAEFRTWPHQETFVKILCNVIITWVCRRPDGGSTEDESQERERPGTSAIGDGERGTPGTEEQRVSDGERPLE